MPPLTVNFLQLAAAALLGALAVFGVMRFLSRDVAPIKLSLDPPTYRALVGVVAFGVVLYVAHANGASWRDALLVAASTVGGALGLELRKTPPPGPPPAAPPAVGAAT